MAGQIAQMEMRRETDAESLRHVSRLLEEERASHSVATAHAEESEAKAIGEAARVRALLSRCEDRLVAAHVVFTRAEGEPNGRRLSLAGPRPGLGRKEQLQMAHQWAEALPGAQWTAEGLIEWGGRQ